MKLVKARHATMLVNENDMYVGKSFVEYGEFSQAEMEFFELVMGKLDKGGSICEVGANIGAHTVPLSKQCDRIWAIEPQRLVYQTLCANLALNNVRNAYPLWAAAGATAGWIDVPDLDPNVRFNFGGLSLEHTGKGDTVPLVKLDELDMQDLKFLKIDVEGMELPVIEGAGATIHRCRPVLYVENDREEKSSRLIQHLIGTLGYECWWHFPPLFRMANFLDNPKNVFPGIVSINMLCVPGEDRSLGEELLPGAKVRHSGETWSEAIVRLHGAKAAA